MGIWRKYWRKEEFKENLQVFDLFQAKSRKWQQEDKYVTNFHIQKDIKPTSFHNAIPIFVLIFLAISQIKIYIFALFFYFSCRIMKFGFIIFFFLKNSFWFSKNLGFWGLAFFLKFFQMKPIYPNNSSFYLQSIN